MLETPHAVVGAAIALAVPNPFLAIPLAFLSHFALDMTPHWNPHISTEKKNYGKITKQSTMIIVGDLIAAVAVTGFLSTRVLPDTNQALLVMSGAFAGMLPDILEAPYFFLNYKNKAIEALMKFQKAIQNDAEPFWGIVTQVVTVIAGLWWIFR